MKPRSVILAENAKKAEAKAKAEAEAKAKAETEAKADINKKGFEAFAANYNDLLKPNANVVRNITTIGKMPTGLKEKLDNKRDAYNEEVRFNNYYNAVQAENETMFDDWQPDPDDSLINQVHGKFRIGGKGKTKKTKSSRKKTKSSRKKTKKNRRN